MLYLCLCAHWLLQRKSLLFCYIHMNSSFKSRENNDIFIQAMPHKSQPVGDDETMIGYQCLENSSQNNDFRKSQKWKPHQPLAKQMSARWEENDKCFIVYLDCVDILVFFFLNRLIDHILCLQTVSLSFCLIKTQMSHWGFSTDKQVHLMNM